MNRVTFLIIVSSVFLILDIYVLIFVWRLKVSTGRKIAILAVTILLTVVGFPWYLWERRKDKRDQLKERQERKEQRAKKRMEKKEKEKRKLERNELEKK
jgi:type VI protein secretion system component VasK